MNIKKLEDKIIHEVFEEVRDIPKGYDKDIQIRAKITERLLFDIKEKTVNKINKERVINEINRLTKKYNDVILRQERAVIIEEIEEYISGIVKSIYQWKMGLYRDLTRENVLDYVLRIDTLLYSLVFCSLNNKRQERLDHESRTYIVPYSDNILEALEQFRNIFYNHYKEDLESYNKLLSMTKGLYDAIKILIGNAS